jgi:hypothetical protein
MVEIAALTCENLSTMSAEVDQNSIAALGSEYIALAKDIKISLREHVQKLVDVPVSVQSVNSMRDHRELETWTLKTAMALKQLSIIASTFQIPLPKNHSPRESQHVDNEMQTS